jgi:regulator of sigma E protease
MLLAIVTLVGFGKVVTFIVMLSILVVLHELGHYILARRNGVHVNEFSVGFGPLIASWKSPKTGTQYSARLFLVGGYCAMYGEDAKTGEAAQQREFREQHETQPIHADDTNYQSKTAWQRLRIIVAGPAMNFILAYAILLFGTLAFGVMSTQSALNVVADVATNSPAAVQGLRIGDRIVAIDGVKVKNGNQLTDTIHRSLGKTITVDYLRNGVRYEFSAKPVRCVTLNPQVEPSERNDGCIGFEPAPAYARVGFLQALNASVSEYGDVADDVFVSLGLIVTHFSQYSSQVTGVIGMGQAATTIQDFGWGAYLKLAATISFALGLFNLLPIPALDGGRAAFIIAEVIRGKPVDPEREGMVHFAGFVVLMMLMVVIAVHDISRIASGRGVF